jgi:hypothetical protein
MSRGKFRAMTSLKHISSQQPSDVPKASRTEQYKLKISMWKEII